MLEVLVVVAILAILGTLGFYAWQPLIGRAEGAKCLSHMRLLHSALTSYVQDVGHWPQEPGVPEEDYDIDADWWIKEMKPYGATEESWMCPSIRRAQKSVPEKERWKVHYSPTIFNAFPTAPYKFAGQPWLIEVVGLHGRGPNICFPDGSIRPLDDLLPKN